MTLQSLTPPQDITWNRLAFSRDMIDTNFTDQAFTPKWRSSLAVYYYLVPDEESADAYPDSRIVYLKLTCSITGYNPSEDLLNAKNGAQASGALDDLQRSLWEVITSSGWASTYWPCLGAIMQIAVYPNNPTGIAPENYPHFIDFEPKKRELYEQVTEGSEFLSGSSDSVSITKGSTNTQSVDVSAGGTFLGIGVSASAGASWQQVDNRTTDTSRESRETSSHTTSFSQMYQLFNGYHLGTNRALFIVLPRPHIVTSSDQTDHNLINGDRKLEGLQDVFLVVNMPKTLDGFCIQAGLDTAHQVTVTVPHYLSRQHEPNGGTEPGDDPTPPPPPPPGQPTRQLVITRRIVQACGTFDENGNFHERALPEPRPPVVIGEIAIPDQVTAVMMHTANLNDRSIRVSLANSLNMMQSQINRKLLDRASFAGYKARSFVESDVFKSLVAFSARRSDIPLIQLAGNNKYMNQNLVQVLARSKITTLGDLFSSPTVGAELPETQSARTDLIEKLLNLKPE